MHLQIKHLFMIKTVKLEIEGNFFDLMKGIYKKPTAYIIINTERLNAYTLRDQEQNRDVFLLLLFSMY